MTHMTHNTDLGRTLCCRARSRIRLESIPYNAEDRQGVTCNECVAAWVKLAESATICKACDGRGWLVIDGDVGVAHIEACDDCKKLREDQAVIAAVLAGVKVCAGYGYCPNLLPCPVHQFEIPVASAQSSGPVTAGDPALPVGDEAERGRRAEDGEGASAPEDPLLRTPRQFLAHALQDFGDAVKHNGTQTGRDAFEQGATFWRLALRMLEHGWTLDGKVRPCACDGRDLSKEVR